MASLPTHLQREIDKLKQAILTLSALVEENYQKAIRSIQQRDIALAHQVIETDQKIDEMEIDIEEECLKILALHQPVAVDLRYIVSILKINNDLERMGDLAADIAKSVTSLCASPKVESPVDITAMADKVQWMVKNSLDAMMNLDAKLAYAVCASDDEVDAMLDKAQERIIQAIQHQPENLKSFFDLLAISSYLEQIGDHAKKVAEDILYTITGDIVRHQKIWKK